MFIFIFRSICKVLFIYFERDRASLSGAGAEKEGEKERERERERIPSWLCTVSTEPDMELGPRNHEIMT